MLLSAVSVLVVAQSSSEIPEGLMNNPVFYFCGVLSDNETFIFSEIIIYKVVTLMSVFIIYIAWKEDALRVSIGVASL